MYTLWPRFEPGAVPGRLPVRTRPPALVYARVACFVVLLWIGALAGPVPGDAAVVDRTAGDAAVVLLEADGTVVERRLLDRTRLPEAAGEGSVLRYDGDAYALDPSATDRRRHRAAERFDRLSDPLDEADRQGFERNLRGKAAPKRSSALSSSAREGI